jgi:hypothetical protein
MAGRDSVDVSAFPAEVMQTLVAGARIKLMNLRWSTADCE